MKRQFQKASILFALLASAACASDPRDASDDASIQGNTSTLYSRKEIVTSGLISVSELAAKLGEDVPLADLAASKNYEALARLAASGEHERLVLGVYGLQAVSSNVLGTAAERAKQAGISGKPIQRGRYAVVSDPNGRELRLNADSGSEFIQDLNRFHASDGAARVPSDAQFAGLARKYLAASLTPEAGKLPLYLYKVRHYLNGEAAEAQSGASVSTYQVAVAFSTAIDDLPVIGAGGKVAVHFDPSAKPIGHEANLRPAVSLLTVVKGSELIAPEKALGVLERQLSERGVDLKQYRLARAEFGYARLGRDSQQNVLAPHYGYVWEPIEKQGLKKLVELVPAFSSPEASALLDRDSAIEQKRKLSRKAAASAETKRE